MFGICRDSTYDARLVAHFPLKTSKKKKRHSSPAIEALWLGHSGYIAALSPPDEHSALNFWIMILQYSVSKLTLFN